MVVGVEPGHLVGLVLGEVLDALVDLEVVLDPEGLAGGVDPPVGVGRVAVQVAVGLGDAAVAHQPDDLMQRFGGQRPEVPHQRLVAQPAAGVALLGVDEVAELDRVADEEDGGVVADQVVVPLLGVELQREAARVAPGVRGALLTGDGREPQERLRPLADLAEEVRLAPLACVTGHLEVTVRGGALGVNDPLRDPLPVEVLHLLEHVAVLHQDRAAGADGDRVVVVRCGGTVVVGAALALVGHPGLLLKA